MLMYTLQNIHKEAMNILTKNGNEKHYVGIMLHNHRHNILHLANFHHLIFNQSICSVLVCYSTFMSAELSREYRGIHKQILGNKGVEHVCTF